MWWLHALHVICTGALLICCIVAFSEIRDLRKQIKNSKPTTTHITEQTVSNVYQTTPDSGVHYSGLTKCVELSYDLFGDANMGGLHYGNTFCPALEAIGGILVTGPIVMTGGGDIFFERAGEFHSMFEAIGYGKTQITHHIQWPSYAENDGVTAAAWSDAYCSGLVVGATCPWRQNWGVDSCHVLGTQSVMCYCGGGYQYDSSSVRLRQFRCTGDASLCVAAFGDLAPGCCSPVEAGDSCNTHARARTCQVAADFDACCAVSDNCVHDGCVLDDIDGCVRGNAHSIFRNLRGVEYDMFDLYAACQGESLIGTICSESMRATYLSMYDDYDECAADTVADVCLADARMRVNSHPWAHGVLATFYNWFDARGYYVLLPPTVWTDCTRPYLSYSTARNGLSQAYLSRWTCNQREALRVHFKLSAFSGNYSVEQGRLAHVFAVLLGGSSDHYCLSRPPSELAVIAYNVAPHQTSTPLWLNLADYDSYDFCATVLLPNSTDQAPADVYWPDVPLGHVFTTRATQYTNTTAFYIQPANGG